MNSPQLSLRELGARSLPPIPWTEGDNIPWNEPAFSERMLQEHLSQSHDLATRRTFIVRAHVDFIHEELLGGRSTQILDLGCGPGLYAHRLARLGHHCVGIDFGPASIQYARRVSESEGLGCRFICADLRKSHFETGYGLVMMIYGQFNVFRRNEALDLLQRSYDALTSGGRILLEVQTEELLQSAGDAAATWYTSDSSVFSDRPHLVLNEHFWDEQSRTSTERWHIVDLESGAVTRQALSCEAYSIGELASLLGAVGFHGVEVFPVLKGSPQDSPLFAMVASKA